MAETSRNSSIQSSNPSTNPSETDNFGQFSFFFSIFQKFEISDLSEFDEMKPIEEVDDDNVWEDLDAQLAETVNAIKGFHY